MKYLIIRSALLDLDKVKPAVSRSLLVSVRDKWSDIAKDIAVFLLGLYSLLLLIFEKT